MKVKLILGEFTEKIKKTAMIFGGGVGPERRGKRDELGND